MKKNKLLVIGISSAIGIIAIILIIKKVKQNSEAKRYVENLTKGNTSNTSSSSNSNVSSSGTLKKGSKGNSVKELQTTLSKLGYTVGTIDGIFGTGTETAVKTFQKANNLTPDGVVGSNTLNALKKVSQAPKIMEQI
jgi:peptidoglycan hydrolase-like protein with peptidoglycan-binding domain